MFFVVIFHLVCCSFISCKSSEVDQVPDHQTIDNYYPSILFEDDVNVFERAAPRLGRASPRLGRASPRLGRRGLALLVSRLNHAGRYHNADDDDSTNEYQYDLDSANQEKRAAPRLGRAI